MARSHLLLTALAGASVVGLASAAQCTGLGADGHVKGAQLQFNTKKDIAMAEQICCHNTMYAEPFGYHQSINFFDALDENKVTTFYDSVCGVPLFKAPVGRTFAAWKAESIWHGWPSFRPEETYQENIVFHAGGEMASTCGTHLGHNLPDTRPRYCIDLVCMAGVRNTTLAPLPTASKCANNTGSKLSNTQAITTRFMKANRACCAPTKAQTGLMCELGPSDTCSEDCNQVFAPMYEDCQDEMHLNMPKFASITAMYQKCKKAFPDWRGYAADHKDHVKPGSISEPPGPGQH